jgi:hypothetical protein
LTHLTEWYTCTAEKMSTFGPHTERATIQVYLHAPRALIFAGGLGQLCQHLLQNWIGRTTADYQAILRWPPRSPDLTPSDFCLMLKTLSLCRFYQRICLSCEDELSLPSQKSIVICCSGYGRKWIIGLTSGLSQSAERHSNYGVCGINLESFSFQLQVTCYNPFRRSSEPIL